jgi:hypothetical protein
VGKNDSIPGTIKDILNKVADPNYTSPSGNPVKVADVKVGQQIWPASEYCWGNSNMKPIFDSLKAAYTAKKVSGIWHTTMAVHGLASTSSLPQKTGFMSLARLLAPFWPSEAFACAPIQPPATYIKTFVKVDVSAVASGNGEEGVVAPANSQLPNRQGNNITYPITITTPVPATGTTTYTDQRDFLERFPTSTWNVNSMTYTVATNTNSVAPAGSLSGGPSNKTVNPGAPTSVGSFATVPRLVK